MHTRVAMLPGTAIGVDWPYVAHAVLGEREAHNRVVFFRPAEAPPLATVRRAEQRGHLCALLQDARAQSSEVRDTAWLRVARDDYAAIAACCTPGAAFSIRALNRLLRTRDAYDALYGDTSLDAYMSTDEKKRASPSESRLRDFVQTLSAGVSLGYASGEIAHASVHKNASASLQLVRTASSFVPSPVSSDDDVRAFVGERHRAFVQAIEQTEKSGVTIGGAADVEHTWAWLLPVDVRQTADTRCSRVGDGIVVPAGDHRDDGDSRVVMPSWTLATNEEALRRATGSLIVVFIVAEFAPCDDDGDASVRDGVLRVTHEPSVRDAAPAQQLAAASSSVASSVAVRADSQHAASSTGASVDPSAAGRRRAAKRGAGEQSAPGNKAHRSQHSDVHATQAGDAHAATTFQHVRARAFSKGGEAWIIDDDDDADLVALRAFLAHQCTSGKRAPRVVLAVPVLTTRMPSRAEPIDPVDVGFTGVTAAMLLPFFVPIGSMSRPSAAPTLPYAIACTVARASRDQEKTAQLQRIRVDPHVHISRMERGVCFASQTTCDAYYAFKRPATARSRVIPHWNAFSAHARDAASAAE